MQNFSTQKIKIKSIKIPTEDFLELEKAIDFACFILSIDAPLDWEDANEMHRRLVDSANLLTSARKQIEETLEVRI